MEVQSSNESWRPTSLVGAPDSRGAVAVWTGSKLLVLTTRVNGAGQEVNVGTSYDPVADTWTPISTAGAPAAHPSQTAVWTGTEMIVWGGGGSNDGGRYDPAADAWTATSTTGAPTGRSGHSAVWASAATGSSGVMIVWGGTDSAGVTNRGGRYDPATDTWSPIALNGPSARTGHTAVWTGEEMIVWGGDDGQFASAGVKAGFKNDGGVYVPGSDTWTKTSIVGAPTARITHTAVWTGSRMIVWGGHGEAGGGVYGLLTNTGAQYDPGTNSWSAMSPSPLLARERHSAVWTGKRMIVWGGRLAVNLFYNDGGQYDPSTDTWPRMSDVGAPAGRTDHVASWTGSTMIVWGGSGPGGLTWESGGRFTPLSLYVKP